MRIIEYTEAYKQQVIDLILHIQNEEAGLNLSLDEQPDLTDVKGCYFDGGGTFLIAVEDGGLIGTIALMNKGDGNGVLKKFFVRKDFRGRGIGLALYKRLYEYAVSRCYKYILLDTPSAAKVSHRFYEKAGFCRIDSAPFEYDYPDRDSYLYLLKL